MADEVEGDEEVVVESKTQLLRRNGCSTGWWEIQTVVVKRGAWREGGDGATPPPPLPPPPPAAPTELFTRRRARKGGLRPPLWAQFPRLGAEHRKTWGAEYSGFYKAMFNDTEDPLCYHHFTARSEADLQCLLFVPRRAHDVRLRASIDDGDDAGVGLKLYVDGEFVRDACAELSVSWLRFVRGVVDVAELPPPTSPRYAQLLSRVRHRVMDETLNMLHTLQLASRSLRNLGPASATADSESATAHRDFDTSIQFYLQHGSQLEQGLHWPEPEPPRHHSKLAGGPSWPAAAAVTVTIGKQIEWWLHAPALLDLVRFRSCKVWLNLPVPAAGRDEACDGQGEAQEGSSSGCSHGTSGLPGPESVWSVARLVGLQHYVETMSEGQEGIFFTDVANMGRHEVARVLWHTAAFPDLVGKAGVQVLLVPPLCVPTLRFHACQYEAGFDAHKAFVYIDVDAPRPVFPARLRGKEERREDSTEEKSAVRTNQRLSDTQSAAGVELTSPDTPSVVLPRMAFE